MLLRIQHNKVVALEIPRKLRREFLKRTVVSDGTLACPNHHHKMRMVHSGLYLLKISPLTLREIARKIHARTEAITEVLDAMYVAGEVKVEGYTSIYSLTEGQ